MRFRPCIDLHGAKVKQIIGSTLSADGAIATENYVAAHDAAYYAGLFCKDGLHGGHICMLGPGNDAQAEAALRAFPGGLQLGGGMTPDNANQWLKKGASHVIVTSYLFENGEFNEERARLLAQKFGPSRLVFDLSCMEKDGRFFVATDRWTRLSSFALTPQSLERLERYCGEFLIHATASEGKRAGIDQKLVALLTGYRGPNAVTYAGGIASLADIELLGEISKGGIDFTVGSALDLFGGTISYRTLAQRFGAHAT